MQGIGYELEIMEEKGQEISGNEEELQEKTRVEVHVEEPYKEPYKTMRVNGRAGNATLHILIDSGSTHNFLDISVAKRLHCRVRKIAPLQVAI